jgi:hypothetical protein
MLRRNCAFLLLLFLVILQLAVSINHRDNSNKVEEGTMGSYSLPAKTNWPELLGQNGEAAKATIEMETGGKVNVQIVPDGSMVTEDYRLDRVRIFVDEEGNVVRSPNIG